MTIINTAFSAELNKKLNQQNLRSSSQTKEKTATQEITTTVASTTLENVRKPKMAGRRRPTKNTRFSSNTKPELKKVEPEIKKEESTKTLEAKEPKPEIKKEEAPKAKETNINTNKRSLCKTIAINTAALGALAALAASAYASRYLAMMAQI